MKERVVVYWARRDLRISDNPALFAAVEFSKKQNIPFLPLFVLEDYMTAGNPKEQFGYPSRLFLSRALPRFGENFKNFTVIRGKGGRTILSIAETLDVTLFVNEDIYKDFFAQLKRIRAGGVTVKLYADSLSISKDTKTGSGNIYSIFTPFKNTVWAEFCAQKVLPKAGIDDTTPFGRLPKKLHSRIIECTQQSLIKEYSDARIFNAGDRTYDISEFLGKPPAYGEWYVDEKSALAEFDSFVKHSLSDYKTKRDGLGISGTSRMSLALAWGLVSARMLRKKIEQHYDADFSKQPIALKLESAIHYISELIWREFYKYLLYHHPELMNLEFQKKFRGSIAWEKGSVAHERFEKWIQGRTGYPIVDAAMMELAQTGYMHNRARMITASVLTKNLGIDWRWGQEYFRAMLIDLDEASNNGGWQWGASVGADPKPIRIFNPYLQAENYDKGGLYQKSYLPESYTLNPPAVIIDHKQARASALARYGLDGPENPPARDY